MWILGLDPYQMLISITTLSLLEQGHGERPEPSPLFCYGGATVSVGHWSNLSKTSPQQRLTSPSSNVNGDPSAPEIVNDNACWNTVFKWRPRWISVVKCQLTFKKCWIGSQELRIKLINNNNDDDSNVKQHSWRRPLIPVLWETEAGGSQVQGCLSCRVNSGPT